MQLNIMKKQMDVSTHFATFKITLELAEAPALAPAMNVWSKTSVSPLQTKLTETLQGNPCYQL